MSSTRRTSRQDLSLDESDVADDIANIDEETSIAGLEDEFLTLRDVQDDLERVEAKFQQAKDVKRGLYDVYVEAYEAQDSYEPFDNVEDIAKRELRVNETLLRGIKTARETVEDLRDATSFLRDLYDGKTLENIETLIDWYDSVLVEFDDVIAKSIDLNRSFRNRQGEMDAPDHTAIKTFLNKKTSEIDHVCQVLLDLEYGYNQSRLNWSTMKAVIQDIDEERNLVIDLNAAFIPLNAIAFSQAESPTEFWLSLIAVICNALAVAEASLIRPEWDNLKDEIHLGNWEALQQHVS